MSHIGLALFEIE
jgi:hypothetical protein